MPDRHRPNHTRTPLPEIAGYRMLRLIAEGGMSSVYLAQQDALGREVAIKVMRPEALADEVSRRRFENEARTIGRLDHPHIVGIHQIGRTDGDRPFFVMPYMPRGHLGERDLRGDQARIREILRALLSALAYAHARGVIHRDVKAENVLFDENDRPLLADFGIALRRGYGSRVTSAGLALGSTAYMAPEQARGEEVDMRADLYAVGVLTWEMLTGRLPFEAQDALSMAVMHAQDPIPRLPPALRHWQKFIDRAMAKYPLKRFHDAGDMLQALEAVPRGTQHAFSPRDAAVAGLARIRALPVSAWIALALLVSVGAGIVLRQSEGDPAEFFRAPSTEPAATARRGATDGGLFEHPENALLRAAPSSEASVLIENAKRQLRERRLVAPAGDNAYEGLLAVAQTAPDHLELPGLCARLIAALGAEAAQAIAQEQDALARGHFERIARLAEAAGQQGQPALAAVHRQAIAALTARADAAALRFERDAARTTLALAESAALAPSARDALQRRVDAIPSVGDILPGDPARMTVVRSGAGAYAMTRRPIGRDEYRRFAEASQRSVTLCRERASVLRVLSHRDWTTPGFEQADGDPVVCVSWDDAAAYARWLSERNGHRYRLPTSTEAAAAALAQVGDHAVAEWLLDCDNGCERRRVRGDSWRRGDGAHARDANRGYDDVGFRLIREP